MKNVRRKYYEVKKGEVRRKRIPRPKKDRVSQMRTAQFMRDCGMDI